MRRTNYGVWTHQEETNENEKAIDYIVECARECGIEVIEMETPLDIIFMAKVMKALKEKHNAQ